MRILIGNDDGLQSPGLALLASAARGLTEDLWVVGPERKWTAASHQLSFDRDLTLTRRGARRFACSGTPVDGVVAAITILCADARPAFVLAGINDKRNVGEDVAYSATMAIAREATFWGIPAVAMSGEGWGGDADRQRPAIERLVQALWSTRSQWSGDDHWVSVNLPRELPAAVTPAHIGRDKIATATDIVSRSDDRVVYRLRRGRPGTSVDGDENAALRANALAITRHRWNAEAPIDDAVLRALRAAASLAGPTLSG